MLQEGVLMFAGLSMVSLIISIRGMGLMIHPASWIVGPGPLLRGLRRTAQAADSEGVVSKLNNSEPVSSLRRERGVLDHDAQVFFVALLLCQGLNEYPTLRGHAHQGCAPRKGPNSMARNGCDIEFGIL